MHSSNEKYAIVIGCNTHWAPYYFRYEQWLIEKGCSFDVIFWNREQREEDIKGHLIEFNVPDTSNNHDSRKVFKFFAFANFVKTTIKKNKYDKVIFLGLQGCALPLNAYYFSKKYHKKYWVDIRDYHYEWFKPYFHIEEKAINNSYYAVISSEGFNQFLPSYAYGKIHNIDPEMESIVKSFEQTKSKAIRLSFIGNVRYFEENAAILRCLGNDNRFLIQYFGPGFEKIKEYSDENGFTNVHFEGAFPAEKTKGFYENTDIINNVYGNHTVETYTALSNKLYYAIYLQMPILVSSDTYMEKICSHYSFACTFKERKGFADELYKWYQYCEKNRSSLGYSTLRQQIEMDERNTREKFDRFIEL